MAFNLWLMRSIMCASTDDFCEYLSLLPKWKKLVPKKPNDMLNLVFSREKKKSVQVVFCRYLWQKYIFRSSHEIINKINCILVASFYIFLQPKCVRWVQCGLKKKKRTRIVSRIKYICYHLGSQLHRTPNGCFIWSAFCLFSIYHYGSLLSTLIFFGQWFGFS